MFFGDDAGNHGGRRLNINGNSRTGRQSQIRQSPSSFVFAFVQGLRAKVWLIIQVCVNGRNMTFHQEATTGHHKQVLLCSVSFCDGSWLRGHRRRLQRS